MPTVPNYGGADEYSLGQQQQSFMPRQQGGPPAAPRGLRPIGGSVFGGGNLFGGNVFGGGGGPSMRNTPAGYSDILAAQRLWSSFVSGLNGGR
jgi:hypothetical protein